MVHEFLGVVHKPDTGVVLV